MKLKTIIVLLILTTVTINAQRQMNVERRLENLTKSLNLTEKQQVEVKVVLVEQKAKVDSIDSSDRTTRRSKMQEILVETNSKILLILDEEQQKIYLERVEGQMKNRGSGNKRKNLE